MCSRGLKLRVAVDEVTLREGEVRNQARRAPVALDETFVLCVFTRRRDLV